MKKLPDFRFEKKLWAKGYFVIGVDEVGTGALAGPVYAGAVCFNCFDIENSSTQFLSHESLTASNAVPSKVKKLLFPRFHKKNSTDSGEISKILKLGINDSKKLSPVKRKMLSRIIKDISLSYATGYVSNKVINKIGIVKATQKAMRQAIHKLKAKLNKKKVYVLIDAYNIKYLKGIGLKNQKAIIKGDEKSISIAAASIIAKVERDQKMIKLDQKYPIYFWKNNKGYGTKKHISALKKSGKSNLHRDLFLRNIFNKSGDA